MTDSMPPTSPLIEPPLDPEDTPPSGMRRLSDTQPTKAIAATSPEAQPRGGWLSTVVYVAALCITTVAALLYFQQGASSTPAPTATSVRVNVVTATETVGRPTQPSQPTEAAPSVAAVSLPLGNVPADVVAELLQQPGDILPPTDAFFRLQSAYTIAPVRPRSTWISYTVQSGDTLEKIAKRFGIAIDTLAWNNDITYVNLLSPGGTLTILPEDGVLHRANGNETLQQIAEKYKVSPYRVIDSDYNPRLQSVNARPETLLPADYMVMVPGGTSEKKLLYWSPKITVGAGTSGGSANVQAGSTVSFGVGQGGSCGSVPNTGGSGSLLLPLPLGSYEVTRGFTSYHSGIDLAGRSGTTVFAADSGYIVYAGWVTYGYGNVVVIAHGSMMTIYGHLSSISVGCGQFVSQGQVVGATGSTGNSSGPHLHFEVRVASGGEFVPVNPAGYRGF